MKTELKPKRWTPHHFAALCALALVTFCCWFSEPNESLEPTLWLILVLLTRAAGVLTAYGCYRLVKHFDACMAEERERQQKEAEAEA